METLTSQASAAGDQRGRGQRSDRFRGEGVQTLRYYLARAQPGSATLLIKSAASPRRSLLFSTSSLGLWTAERYVAFGDEIHMETLVTDKNRIVWPELPSFMLALDPWLEDEWDGVLTAEIAAATLEPLLRVLPQHLYEPAGVIDVAGLCDGFAVPLPDSVGEWEGML